MTTIAEKTKEYADFIRKNTDGECVQFVLTIDRKGNNYAVELFNKDDAEWRTTSDGAYHGHDATRRNLRGERIGAEGDK